MHATAAAERPRTCAVARRSTSPSMSTTRWPAGARRVGGARVARPASRGHAQLCRTSKFEAGNPFAAELRETAAYISSRGKGILASDESNATTGKRLATVDVENTEDNRRAWRECLYTAPGLGQYISGMLPQSMLRAVLRAVRCELHDPADGLAGPRWACRRASCSHAGP